jgi:hypothetical protein
MTETTPALADPERVRMIQSTRTWSTLETVARAVAAAGETEPIAYVERRADEYRWSLATKGGGYPLLRVSARFLGVDHQRIFVGFRTLPDGTAILCEDPANVEIPDRWALLELSGSATAAAVAWRIRTTLGAGDPES